MVVAGVVMHVNLVTMVVGGAVDPTGAVDPANSRSQESLAAVHISVPNTVHISSVAIVVVTPSRCDILPPVNIISTAFVTITVIVSSSVSARGGPLLSPTSPRRPPHGSIKLLIETLPGSQDVDHHVPNPLQRQDDRARQIQPEVGACGIDNRVHAVDTRGRPGHQDGNGKDEGGAEVG